jgi:hypothetical protein
MAVSPKKVFWREFWMVVLSFVTGVMVLIIAVVLIFVAQFLVEHAGIRNLLALGAIWSTVALLSLLLLIAAVIFNLVARDIYRSQLVPAWQRYRGVAS